MRRTALQQGASVDQHAMSTDVHATLVLTLSPCAGRSNEVRGVPFAEAGTCCTCARACSCVPVPPSCVLMPLSSSGVGVITVVSAFAAVAAVELTSPARACCPPHDLVLHALWFGCLPSLSQLIVTYHVRRQALAFSLTRCHLTHIAYDNPLMTVIMRRGQCRAGPCRSENDSPTSGPDGCSVV